MKKSKILAILAAGVMSTSLAVVAFAGCGGAPEAKDFVFEAEDAELVQAETAEKDLTVEHGYEWVEGYNQDDPDTPVGPEVVAIGNTEYVGTQIVFTINSTHECDATLKFRVASRRMNYDWVTWTGWGEMLEIDMASEDKSYSLTVNGTEVGMTGILPGTPDSNGWWAVSYAHYGEATARIHLKKGENKLVFEVVKYGGNVDKITINAASELTMTKVDNSDRIDIKQ